MRRLSDKALHMTHDWCMSYEDHDEGQSLLLEMAACIEEELAKRYHSKWLDDNRERLERACLPRWEDGSPAMTWASFKRKAMAHFMREYREQAEGAGDTE